MAQNLNGVRVRHAKYGVGTICYHNGDSFKVVFSKGDEQAFLVFALNKEIYGFDTKDKIQIAGYVKNNKKDAIQSTRINAIKQILKKRHIEYLIHFTTKNNLESIKKHGLLPLNHLRDKKLKFRQNDNKRLDGTNAICMTVTRPNWPLFQRFQQIDDDNSSWVALKLNAEDVLTKCDCKFCPVNAATDKGKCILPSTSPTASDFEKLFERTTYSDKWLCDSYTTDPQAEVLVFSDIPYSYVDKVIDNPTYSKILGEELVIQKSVCGNPISRNISYNRFGKYNKEILAKSKESYAFLGEIDSDNILIVCGADNKAFMNSFMDSVKEHGSYKGGMKILKQLGWEDLIKYRGIAYMDKSITTGRYDNIMVGSVMILIRDIISVMAPNLI